ncbi:hypothetical protein C7271_11170, partial [filamentous cyanobacterium CCP5]
MATISGYALLLFLLSSLRHALFQSGALDLGYHDQILYLLSRGEPPIVSFWGYHFLGGHAEWIYYGLAGLYRIYANVHWLLAVQAVALAIAIWPMLRLADQAGLNHRQGWTIAIAYLLYPLVFNVNLFDFHPEVMAVPLILTSVLTAREQQPVGFAITTTLILGCRASLSLLLVFMGLWLILFERRRWYGAYALVIGTGWFWVFSRILVPLFKPDGYHALNRYGSLGSSISEVIFNVFLKPGTTLQQLFTLSNLEYLVLLLVPVLWGLSWRRLAPLFACLPILGMNLLSESLAQKNLIFQYSLPILPFLMLAVISSLAAKECLLQKRRWIVLWCLICFAALGKYSHFTGLYLSSLDTWSATRQAIAQVDTKAPVLTTHSIVPHLSHRPIIHFTAEASRDADLRQYEFVLLNLRTPGYESSAELAQYLLSKLENDSVFEQKYSQDDVYLF